jgi:hypothetical protein
MSRRGPSWGEFRSFLEQGTTSHHKADRAAAYAGASVTLAKVAIGVAPIAIPAVVCGAITVPIWAVSKLWAYANRPRQLRAAGEALEARGFEPEKYLPK